MKKMAVLATVFAILVVAPSLVSTPSEASPGPDFDLLIIAPQAFEDELVPLKQFKDATGRPSVIVTLEDIYTNYTGADKAEQVKKCIADYEADHHIRYVLLVGDVDQIPMRYFYLKRMNATHVNWLQYYLTDHYYADLYDSGGFCDWNDNGNGIFGEIIDDDNDGDYTNVDGINFSFDVVVGRIPAATEGEVAIYVDKVIRYETEVYYDSWFKNILLVTGTGDWIYPDVNSTWDETQNDQIATEMATAGFTAIKLYHTNTPGDPDYPNPTNINTYLNAGAGFMNVISHGNEFSWGVYDVRTDLSGLDNRDKLTVVYSFGCATAKLGPIAAMDQYIDVDGTLRNYGTDYDPSYYPHPLGTWAEPAVPHPLQASSTDIDCMPEYWNFASANGSVAFIGSTAEASGTMGSPVMQYFFESFASDGHRVLGDVWNSVCDKVLTGGHNIESSWDRSRRWLYINLFGDPTLALGGLPDKPPETTLSIGSPSMTIGSDTYVSGDTPMTLMASDDSAVDSTWYRYYLEGEPAPSFSSYTGPFTISGTDGLYTIEYYSVDDANNSEYPINAQQVKVDNTPPDINVTVGHPSYYVIDLESDNGGFTHAGANDDWEWGAPIAGPGSAHSGSNCWGTNLDGTYMDDTDAMLMTPEFTVPPSLSFSFWHWMDGFGSGTSVWDGGNLKISTDGGDTWVLLTPDGGYGYTGASSNTGIAYEPCFNWDIPTWTQVTVDLSAYAGQDVIIAWHWGTSSVVVYDGWYIDDVILVRNMFVTHHTPVWINATDNGTESCIVGSVNLTVVVEYQGIEIYNVSDYVENAGEWARVFPDPAVIFEDNCTHHMNVTAIDDLGNTATYNLTLYVDNVKPNSSIDLASPYCQNVSVANPFQINGSIVDYPLGCASGVKNATLWYRYARYNHSFTGWFSLGADESAPWNWLFTAPNGSGYYQFYVAACDNLGHCELYPPDGSTVPRALLSVSYNYSCDLFYNQTGWNLFTVPVQQPSLGRASDLVDFVNSFSSDSCTVVTRWLRGEQRFVSYVVLPDGGSSGVDFVLVPGEGYFVYVTCNVTGLFLEGCLVEYDDISLMLHSGYSLIGWANLETTWASRLAGNISGCTKVALWNATVQAWDPEYIVGLPDYDFDVEMGTAMFVFRPEVATLPWDGGRTMLVLPP